jgi:hypothetical protein
VWFVLLAALSIPLIASAQQPGNIAIVFADGAPIFDSMSTPRTMIRGVVQGATFPVLKADDQWVQVTIGPGRDGYIPAHYVEVLAPGKYPDKLFRAQIKPPSSASAPNAPAALSVQTMPALVRAETAVIERKCQAD